MGDEIASTSGNPVIITSIKGDASERDVYNLTINEDHSYAVGELGVWSHNVRHPILTIYKKVDINGKFLKWGITHHKIPSKRYPKHSRVGNLALDGGTCIPVARLPREKAFLLERFLVRTRPGRQNFETWAGRGARF